MKVIIQNRIFHGDKGKQDLFAILDTMDRIDNKSIIEFQACEFIAVPFDTSDIDPLSFKGVVVNWIISEQVKKLTPC